MSKATRQSKSSKQKTMPIVKQKGTVGPLKDDFTIYRSLRNLFTSQGEVIKPYNQSVWAYATIKSIAMNISRTPFVAYQGQYGDAEKKEIIEWPEQYKVFKQPNPFMSMEMLIEAISTYLDLRGEAFLILEGRNNVAEMPQEIWTFDPLRFEPNFINDGKTLIGWKYAGIEDIPFGLHEIIHIKYFNPYDDYRGISPLTAAQMSVDQEYFANQYNKAFFKEGAPTGGFIEVADGLSDPQYNRLLKQFEDRHKGASKAHRIGILEGGGKFVQAQITQKDMDFIESKKMSRVEIFAVFKANPVAMGIYEDVKSYEGSKEARKSFWQECIIPRQELIVNTLWWALFSKIGSGQIWAEFDRSTIEALQEDFDKKLAAAERMTNMGWPINAINKKLGLGMEDVPWGDVTWKPIGMMPVSGAEATAFPIKEIPKGLDPKVQFIPKAISPKREEYGKQVILPAKFTLIKKSTQGKSVEAETSWKIFLIKQIPLEKTFYSKVKRFLFEQRSRVLEKLHSSMNKDLSDEIFNEDKEIKAMQKLVRPLYELSLKDGAGMAAEQVGNAGFVFNPLDKDFLQYMEMRVTKIPKSMVRTVKDQLREAITEGITLGETVNELADRVKNIYNVASSRALTIARTESASSINAGRFIQLEKEGVKRHEWVTALDEAVRDSHKALEGSVAEIGEEFDFRGKGEFSGSSGLKYPGDMDGEPGEVINCRCVTVPVIVTKEEEEKEIPFSQEDLKEGQYKIEEFSNGNFNANEVKKIDFKNGNSVIFKPVDGEVIDKKAVKIGTLYEREILAYKIDNEIFKFNLVPYTARLEVLSNIPDKIEVGSAQLFIDAKLGSSIDKNMLKRYFLESDKNKSLPVFDYIIGQADRHRGNFLVDDEHNFVAIDNGLSFLNVEIGASWNIENFLKTTLEFTSDDLSNIEIPSLFWKAIDNVNLEDVEKMIEEIMKGNTSRLVVGRLKKIQNTPIESRQNFRFLLEYLRR